MAEIAYIAVGVIFLIAFLFLLSKFLTPGVFFQLNSNLRYEQLADRIEESYQHGFIDEKERIYLKNWLSTNAITLWRIRRKLNKIIQNHDPSEGQRSNVSYSNKTTQNSKEVDAESSNHDVSDVSSTTDQTITGKKNTQFSSKGATTAAIGDNAVASEGPITINQGVDAKDYAEALAEIDRLKEKQP